MRVRVRGEGLGVTAGLYIEGYSVLSPAHLRANKISIFLQYLAGKLYCLLQLTIVNRI